MQTLTIVSSAPDRLFGLSDLRQSGLLVTARADPQHIVGADTRPALGALGVMADNLLGYAVMASLPQGSWSISTEIWIDVVAPDAVGRVISGDAEALQTGSFSAGRLFDGAQVVATCRQRGRRAEPLDLAAIHSHVQDHWEAKPGCADLGELLGLRCVDDGHVLEVGDEHLNPRGMLHGGVSLAASEFVATASRVRAGSTLPTASVHIVHTRGVPRRARIRFEASTKHHGRTLWVSEVIGLVDDKVCTVATVTAQ